MNQHTSVTTLHRSLTRFVRTAIQGTVAGLCLIAASQGLAANRTLVLLQENSGRTALDDILPAGLRAAARVVVDRAVEDSEAEKFRRLAAGRYQRFVNLSDWNCTRQSLLNTLMNETDAGYTVDLVVLGHGNTEQLRLHGLGHLFGATDRDPGNLRSLLADARQVRQPNYAFNLRLVYMCNCMGSTLNDDWLAIGAKVSVGPRRNNALHEPMITAFWNDFVLGDRSVADAADDSYAIAKLAYGPIPGFNSVDRESGLTRFQEAEQIVRGNRNLIFRDEFQLAVGDSRNVSVAADRIHTFPGVYLVEGQSYRIRATGSWRNSHSARWVDADGYGSASFLDAGRRYGNHSPMRLLGERFRHNGDAGPFSFIGGSVLNVGTVKSFTAGGSGFLSLFANDALATYGDNSGRMTVTITRTR